MEKLSIRETLMDFKNALGICHFSKELSETEFNLISIVTENQEVNKLEQKGYLEKYTLPTNKKEIYLKIGKKSLEQYNLVMDKVVLFFERLFEEVGQEGMDNITKYIEIAKRIGKEMKEKGECICCN